MAPPSTGHALQDFKTLPQKSGWKMHRYSLLTFGTEAQVRYPQQLCVCYWMSVTVLPSIGFILLANMILIGNFHFSMSFDFLVLSHFKVVWIIFFFIATTNAIYNDDTLASSLLSQECCYPQVDWKKSLAYKVLHILIPLAKWIRLLTGFHITLVMAWDFARHAIEIRKALQRAKERTDPCIAISFGTERRCACLFLVLLIVPGSLMWNVFVLPSPFMILLMEIAAAILGLLITSWTLMYPLFFLDKNRQDH
jgi:hypothetical protein